MARRQQRVTTWTVLNAGPCPACGTLAADVTCTAGRHHCGACGADRGPCDRVPAAPHWRQLELF